jgi:hypothetical protein
MNNYQSIEYRHLKKLMASLKKHHKHMDDSAYVTIVSKVDSNGMGLQTIKGTYDCPPIAFEYRFGFSTDWKFKRIK